MLILPSPIKLEFNLLVLFIVACLPAKDELIELILFSAVAVLFCRELIYPYWVVEVFCKFVILVELFETTADNAFKLPETSTILLFKVVILVLIEFIELLFAVILCVLFVIFNLFPEISLWILFKLVAKSPWIELK